MTDCQLWTGAMSKNGYGAIKRGGRNLSAHRVAWEVAYGPIPEGLFVLHRCDNPPCVNVSHLFLGTQRENMRDMREKGRSNRGERNSHAVLTTAGVRAIREASQSGVDPSALARAYGVNPSQIRRIRNHKAWVHV